jgi:hypothetical protein
MPSDTTYALTASDRQNTSSSQTTIAFRNKRYWGMSGSDSLNNAGVLGLSSEFATDCNKSVTYGATGGKYLYYAFPVSFGTPSDVIVGGLSFSDLTVSTLSLTNASWHIESYNVIRLNNRQTGPAIAVVWAQPPPKPRLAPGVESLNIPLTRPRNRNRIRPSEAGKGRMAGHLDEEAFVQMKG